MTNRIATRKHSDVPVNVLCLVKDGERYVFLFDDAHRIDVFKALGRAASNEDLSFTWYDAAVLSQKIRERRDDA